MKCAVTGTFDPLTFGHIELVEKALKLFDEVVVLMLVNPEKNAEYSHEVRLDAIKEYFKNRKNVSADYYEGYAVDYCNKNGIGCLIRGIRNKEDFPYEKQMAKFNLEKGGIPTVFFFSDCSHITSTKARQKLKNNLSAEEFIPDTVEKKLKENK